MMVPGLSDSRGVSFESVNHPGHYLRHYNFNLRLDADDGSDIFRQDATFFRRAGLADSDWASFESVNFPGYYIRHNNFALGIVLITTETEMQYATFRRVDGISPTPTPTPTPTAPSRYIFTLFTNSSESNMYVYQSDDGINYTCIKGPAYIPPAGLVRDPSLIKHTDGAYYIVYTTNWEGTNFGIARSTDLRTWTFVTNIEVNVPDIKNTWAPECFVDTDGSVNIIVSLRTNSSFNFTP